MPSCYGSLGWRKIFTLGHSPIWEHRHNLPKSSGTGAVVLGLLPGPSMLSGALILTWSIPYLSKRA